MSLHIGCGPDVTAVKGLTLKDSRGESKMAQKYEWFPTDVDADLVR